MAYWGPAWLRGKRIWTNTDYIEAEQTLPTSTGTDSRATINDISNLNSESNSESSDSVDTLTDVEENNKSTDKPFKHVVVLNANEHSLGPKIESLADCVEELDAKFAIVTETWLQNRGVEHATIDLAGQHGLELFMLNRNNNAANGRQYGWVAILARGSCTTIKVLDIPNPENF